MSESAASPRVALVTGSCVRTGRALVLELASQGWHVVVHGKPSARQQAEETARPQVSRPEGPSLAAPEDCEARPSIRAQPAPGGNGWHELVASPLPAWNESWAPEVQVQWLRSATTLALAGIIASIKPTAAIAA